MEEDSRGPNGCADCHDPKEIKPTKKATAPKKP
jgi:formate-dependent nitrite reductase cytochrome c552 subunit